MMLLGACLLPAMALGLWVGRRLTRKLSREAFVRLVDWVVLGGKRQRERIARRERYS